MSQPSQNPSNQPISFKTIPGRNRTQKWQQAKTNNYDGDDWGGYDDYDDYGGYQEPSSAQQQPAQQLQRQSSFDRGVDTERRQFSSGTAIHDSERYTSPNGSGGRISQDSKSPDEARRRMREFSNPGQVPHPLNTPRSPVAPGSVERPPRGSSLGSQSPDARPIHAPTSPSMDKSLPFVRPSDIYKRMAEEQQKERQSMESGRPSMDSVQREVGSPSLAQHTLFPTRSHESGSGRRPSLDPVSENREPEPVIPEHTVPASAEKLAPNMTIVQPTIQHTGLPPQESSRLSESSPRLPPVSRISGFGSFMPRDKEEERLSATGLAASTAAANAAASAISSGSRDVTPTMPAGTSHSAYDQPSRSTDPAAEIAAERSTNVPVEHLGRSINEDPSGLSHQPSSGFRSVVHKAFDRQGDDSIPASPVSRDNTQSNVSRSDTNSTGNISPIMSRVPSAATAQNRQQDRDAVVSPIAEETPLEIARSRPGQESTAPAITSRPSVLRKPTPNQSRHVSSEVVGFTPGYRRSMDTPSPNNSPARTPGLGDTDKRRLSGPMSAVTVTDPEAPDVDPAAPEMPSATLEPVESPMETPGSTYPGTNDSDYVKPLPTSGRGRSGTDYSMRESDLAREANTSPETSTTLAEAATLQQNLFLDTHPSNPGTPTVLSPTTGLPRPFPLQTSSGSGRNSPAGTNRSRVRNIVDQFHQIDEDSRRHSAASGMSSKSSWSNFGGDEEGQPGLNRKTTGGSALSQQPSGSPAGDTMFPSYDRAGQDPLTSPSATLPLRPAPERIESFQPHLPGEWVSAAPTPAEEVPGGGTTDTLRGRDHTSRDITPRGPPLASPDEEVDLTPTTRKTKLQGGEPTVDESQTALSAVKNAGDALGTALMSSVGFGHQTRDFASTGNDAAPVDIPEMRPHRATGNIHDSNVPALRRWDSDAPSDGTNSVANSVPPTPLAKDTPQPAGLAPNAGPSAGRPVSNYFAGYTPDAVAPLSFGKHSPSNSHDLASTRPAMLPSLSTDTRATDFESDRLRKDIVRSLGPERMAELKRESILEDVDRAQDALDAPENAHRVASGQSTLPAAEIKNTDGRSGLPSQSARPGLLGQRFSWEKGSTTGSDFLQAPMAVIGESKGDEGRESYERPRSGQGLHVVNTQVTADSEPSTAGTDVQAEPRFMVNEPAEAENRLSAALPVGTADLALGSHDNAQSRRVASPIAESPESVHTGLDQLAPTPMVEDVDEAAARGAESQSPSAPPGSDSPTLPSASATSPQTPNTAHSKIPAFRDLAAIKSTDDRIAAYESTRHRFADMNTGLSGWLSGMMASHPEYANAANEKYEGPAVIQTAGLSNAISGIGGTIRGAGHKHSPSILKIGGERKTGGERKASATSTTGAAPASSSGGGHADVEKMQAKGKDFMKSAGAGAKGLFAKGKSRFGRGGEKASSSVSSPLTIAPAFTAVDTSSKSRDTTTPKVEKTHPSSRPITPVGLQTVGDDVKVADGAAPATDTTRERERPRSVFGRLRDVSRSNTRSRSRPGSMVFGSGFGDKSPGPSRSVSRAASLVFGNGGDAEPAPPLPVISPPIPALGAQVPASGSPGVLPGPEERRREMWEDDGAAACWRDRDEDGRLGVLPSPSVQESVGPGSPGKGRKGSWVGEPVESPLEERRGEEDAAELERERDDANWMLEPVALPVAGAGAAVAGPELLSMQDSKPRDHSAPAMPLKTELPIADSALPAISDPEARRSSLEHAKVRKAPPKHTQSRSASYASQPPPAMARPQPERKVSALDQLPSQQRRRQYTPVATPRRMSLADGETFDPMPPPGVTPARVPQPDAVTAEFGSLADAKPKSQTKTSRPATPANWDQFSAVSAPKKTDDAASRRSSVSSLGHPQSPDTVVIPGAASKRHSMIGMPIMTSDAEAPDEQYRSVSPLPLESDAAGPAGTRVSGIPTLDPDSMLASGPAQTDRFMDRGYQADQQRPMSYMPSHSRDTSSILLQDMAEGPQGNKRFSTPGGTTDYSVTSAAAYQQLPAQPLSRAPSSLGHPPSEYDKLRSPQAGDADPVIGDDISRQSSGFFRGSDAAPAGALTAIPSPSKIDDNYDGLIDPQVSEFADEITKAEQQQQLPQKRRKSGILGTFRRASVHSSANASRPSSGGSLSAIAAANANASANETSLAKSKTLKKPQRAPSAAVEPPKNKRFSSLGSLFRRSSTMGSPRASAQAPSPIGAPGVVQGATPTGSRTPNKTAATPPPSKKLRKAQPPQAQQQYSQRLSEQYAGPPPGNYGSYEAMMRQQQAAPTHGQLTPSQYAQQQQPIYSEPAMVSPPYQQQALAGAYPQRQSGYYQQGPPQGHFQQVSPQSSVQQYQASAPHSRTHSLVASPVSEQGPPTEYFGGQPGQPSAGYGQAYSQPMSPPSQQPMPQMRRLHSEGYRRRDTVPDIPEANSPVSSYRPSVEQVRSQTDGQVESGRQEQPQRPVTGPSRPSANTRQSSAYSQSSVIVSPVAAQPDNFPQAPGRQDYQTQYWQHQHQNQPQRRQPTLPSLQTQAQPAHQQSGSVGSIDQQVARSPALEYQDQQRPWPVSLPQSQDSSNRTSGAPSWAQQQPAARPPQPHYMGAPAAAQGAVRTASPPQHYQDQYSAMTPYHFVPPQQMQHMAPQQGQQRTSSYGSEQVSSPTTYSPVSPQQPQPSRPMSYMPTSSQQQEQSYGQPQQYHSAYAQPQQQQRAPAPQNRYYGQQGSMSEQARPLTYQRTASGYSGRRDDAGVSEAEIMSMRGASYPGQEWAPGRG